MLLFSHNVIRTASVDHSMCVWVVLITGVALYKLEALDSSGTFNKGIILTEWKERCVHSGKAAEC